jgi:enamine deaminase RidA (YjgF/YER057c/UK114 family)
MEEKFKELGLIIPNMSEPVANYLPYMVHENLVYVSGQPPVADGKVTHKGKVGQSLSIEEGQEAARVCCINIIAALKHAIGGDWNRFDRIIKVGGFVNCGDDFTQHPQVINGASDMLVKIFGEKGRHARFAVGSNSLPLDIAVEIDAIIAIK